MPAFVVVSRTSIGPAAYTGFRWFGVAWVLLVSQPEPLDNVDLLAWFSEDERHVCESCGDRSAVSVPDALASFCLRCGAVTIEGVRPDLDLVIPV
jgi:hypothetical protein